MINGGVKFTARVRCVKHNPKAGEFEKVNHRLRAGIVDESRRLAILFDMDGVLVDVTSSYRRAIQETVRFFSGEEAYLEEIQTLKEKGGYNNDWDLTEAILIGKGKSVPKTEIVEKFQELYHGTKDRVGFIESERWLLSSELLPRLKARYTLGIVTGRPKEEAMFVLRKFNLEHLFDVIVAMEDYPPERSKPNPYPINLALSRIGKMDAIYIGDSVDDMIAARRADVRPIGCISPGMAGTQMRDLLVRNGAIAILDDINDIERILP
jgi:HAD superfamily phosphatase